jgi:uncharacterized protein (DUF779 family)
MTSLVTATPEALEVIERLRAVHGTLVFFQSGGCCEGTTPICLKEGELPPGPGDVRLGDIGHAAFHIDADQYQRWGRPRFVVDVAPGATESFSLEGVESLHFVTRTAEDRPTDRRV